MLRASWVGGAVVLAVLSSSGCDRRPPPPEPETGASAAAILSASSVLVDPSHLATGTQQIIRIDGPGFDQVIDTPTSFSFADGVYSVHDYTGAAAYGSFTVTGGDVVGSTGAVSLGPSSIGFDLSLLGAVSFDATVLEAPFEGQLDVVVGGATADVFQGRATLHLPDATYTLLLGRDYALGTFTISGSALTAATGALVVNGASLGFDLTQLAAVSIPEAGLGPPQSPVDLFLMAPDAGIGLMQRDTVFYLPAGTYTLGNPYAGTSYGTFTVAGGAVATTTGALLPAAGGVTFDATQLASVLVDTTPFSSPVNLGYLRLTSTEAIFRPSTFLLPDGVYTLSDVFGGHPFGTFTIAGHMLTGTTGALVPTASGVTLDTTKLTKVVIPLAGLSSPTAGLMVGIIGPITQQLVGTDPTFYFPDGTYTLTSVFGVNTFGSFTTAAGSILAPTGAFTLTPSGALAFNRCALNGVAVALARSASLPIDFATSYFGGTQTFWLPDGSYTFRGYAPYGLTVAGGALTSVSLPPGGPVLSVTHVPCQVPPTVTCVGSAGSPVTLPGSCSVTVDDVGQLAGGCSGGGGGLASCTFDGAASEALGPGDHAVVVLGTAGDGSTATCTSYVRVSPCAIPPLVTCAGTALRSALIPTDPGTCGAVVSVADARAGTCANGGDGVASCTVDGAASETLALGLHAVTVAGTSNDGASAQCTAYLSVVDQEPPAIACPPATQVECTGASTPVALSATCTDNCGACSASCGPASFPLGAGTAVCSAADASSNSATCSVQVTVVDTTPPSLSMTVSPTVLDPPDNKLVPVAIATSASDACDGAPSVSCTVAELTPPSKLAPDVVWSGGRLSLRAAKGDEGSERDYLITCVARDASGNTRSRSTKVIVPKDESGGG